MTDETSKQRRVSSRRGLSLAVLALACATVFSVAYVAREQKHVQELAASRDELSMALTQARSQVDALTAKVDALSAAQQRASAHPTAQPRKRSPGKAAAARPADDPRWKQVQEKLSEQEKQIASTREETEKTKEELQTSLSSTRDELSGSIARTHEELVALEKRGERNYHEFQLPKSKQFQRVGGISLALRKVDYKHKSYDVTMIVDDFRLEKKRVNLYEPVWITVGDRPQPLELVVNQLSKNQVQGYLSEPKYKKSELAVSAKPEPKPELQDEF